MIKLLTLILTIYPELMKGLWVSLKLSAGALLLGLALGLPLSLIKTYGKGIPRALASGYIEIIRGTPMVVQLFIVYFGLPDMGILLDRVTAAIIALGLNSSAYQAEYFRGALLSIDSGQMMAAKALGMTENQAIAHVLLPQALRLVIPPWSNELIYMVKYTSVAFLIAVPELMGKGKIIISRNFLPLETLFWVGAVYVFVLSILAKMVDMLEKHYAIPGFEMSRED